MTDHFGVIKLEPSQWQEYKILRLDALQKEPQAFLSTFEREAGFPDDKWQQRLADLFKGRSGALFAKADSGALIGMIGYYRDENAIVNHTAEIWGVYVTKEARGKGVAKALMQGILEEMCKDQDIETAVLEVNTDQKSAQKLYESFGFKTTKTTTRVLGDGLEHEVTEMRKVLVHGKS